MVNDVMNEQYIKKPHLPTADVTLVVMSARKPLLIEALKKREHRVFLIEEEPVKNGDKPYKPGDFKLPPPPKDDKKQKLYW